MRLGGCSAQSFDVLEKNVSQLKCTKIEDWLINHVSLMKTWMYEMCKKISIVVDF